MSKVSNTSPNARKWLFLKTASLAATLSYSLILPWTLQISGYILAFCIWFRFHVSLLALLCSRHSFFFPFWRRNNETASAAQRWEWKSYVSVHTSCKQDILIAFLNSTDVCPQATPLIAFLKRDGSWGHTPPTENTFYKISSLTLRCSAISITIVQSYTENITGLFLSVLLQVYSMCNNANSNKQSDIASGIACYYGDNDLTIWAFNFTACSDAVHMTCSTWYGFLGDLY